MAVMLAVGWDNCHPNLPKLVKTCANSPKLDQNCFTLIEEYSSFDTLSVGNEKLSTAMPQAT